MTTKAQKNMTKVCEEVRTASKAVTEAMERALEALSKITEAPMKKPTNSKNKKAMVTLKNLQSKMPNAFCCVSTEYRLAIAFQPSAPGMKFEDCQYIFVSVAYCNPKDKFDETMGKIAALKRLYSRRGISFRWPKGTTPQRMAEFLISMFA